MSPGARGHLAMFCFSALVAGSFALGTRIANEISPVAFNAVRFVIAALILGAGVLIQRQLTRQAFAASWRYLVLGALFATYFVLMFEGLKTAPSVSAAAVFTLIPAMSGVFGWLLLRQVTSLPMAAALAIGGVGALWVVFRADLQAFFAFEVGSGEMIYFLGCIAHALYTPMLRKLNRGEPALVFSFGVLVAGAVLLLIYGLNDIVATDWFGLRPMVWWSLIYIAVIASAASFVLLQFASLRLPSAKVMAYTYLTPSWVILWEIGLGGDFPPLALLGGVCFTIVALLILLRVE